MRSARLLALALGLMLPLALVPPAAATTCSAVAFAQPVADVVISATGHAATLVSVSGYDNCSYSGTGPGIRSVSINAVNPGRDAQRVDLSLAAGTQTHGVWQGTLQFDELSAVGTWYMSITATDDDQQVRSPREEAFRVRRATVLRSDARPEPAVRGHRLTVSGRLRGLSPALEYRPLRDRVVRIYFRREGQSDRVLMGSTRTNRYGRFVDAFEARRSGRWYAYFPGASAYAPRWSVGDRVWIR